MKRLIAWGVLAMACAGLPAAAHAQDRVSVTTKDVHVRAGPARDYPVVAILPAGSQVEVHGCLVGYTWCDVDAGLARGWVYAGNLHFAYQNSFVPLPSYGDAFGVAIIAFILGDYWGAHYHDRPWYGERNRWSHPPRPPPWEAPRLPPPRPPHNAGPGHPPAPRPPAQAREGRPGEPAGQPHRDPPRARGAPADRGNKSERSDQGVKGERPPSRAPGGGGDSDHRPESPRGGGAGDRRP